MSRYVLLRLLETFLRRWPLYLLPLILLAGFGALSASQVKDEYLSAGTINIDTDPLLAELTSIRGEDTFSYETPAAITARKINELLQTEEFIGIVAQAADLTEAVNVGAITLDDIRASISSWASGSNFVTVASRHENPEVAYRLAASTINSYKQWEIDAGLSDTQVALDFLTARRDEYQVAYDAVNDEFNQWLLDHQPNPVTDQYSPDDQIAIDQLIEERAAAKAKLDSVLAQLDTAELTRQQTQADVDQRLKAVDDPQLPTARQPKIRKMVLGFAVFLVIGGLFSVGAIVIGASIDHSLRFPIDVRQRLGATVLAVVPDVNR